MSHNAASSPAALHTACPLAVWFVHRPLIGVWPGEGEGTETTVCSLNSEFAALVRKIVGDKG